MKLTVVQVQWDPNAILDGFLTQSYDSKTRCGVFFIALGFSFAQVTTMIFANLIAAGNDTAAMWPKYATLDLFLEGCSQRSLM
jgi:nucleobase:cation symporter-1, NCS1 family